MVSLTFLNTLCFTIYASARRVVGVDDARVTGSMTYAVHRLMRVYFFGISCHLPSPSEFLSVIFTLRVHCHPFDGFSFSFVPLTISSLSANSALTRAYCSPAPRSAYRPPSCRRRSNS